MSEPRAPSWDDLQPRFRELRERRGLDSLALELDASRASIDRWARGLSTPLPLYARRIAHAVARADQSQVGREPRP